MLLTQSTTPIIGQIAWLLGYVMDGIFRFLGLFGIENIGLCIIIFTIIVRIFMLPMTYKQQKFSKMSQAMQPEIQKIQKKYRGKRDQVSMQKQNQEIQAVYDKYGVSMSGGCLQLLIQMPIFFALYQVIRNIPAYIPQVKAEFTAIINGIKISDSATIEAIQKAGKGISSYAGLDKLTTASEANKVIDALNYFNQEAWAKLAKLLPGSSDLITTHSSRIIKMNDFLPGINITQTPGWGFSIYLLIPLFAALFQYLAAKTMQSPQTQGTGADMSKTMTWMMPFMSFFICVTTPAGLGIYWATSAAFQLVQQVIVNKMMENADIDAMIEENMAKAEKRKASGKKTLTERLMSRSNQAQTEEKKPSGPSLVDANSNLKNLSSPKLKGVKEKGFESEEYYEVLQSIDHKKLGEISRLSYLVSEFDKKYSSQSSGKNQGKGNNYKYQ